MKRSRRILSVILGLCLLGACAAPGSASSESGGPGGSSELSESILPRASSVSAGEEREEAAESVTLKCMLPSSHSELAAVLNQVAEKQGVELRVFTGPNEPGYTRALLEALAGEEPPELYWVPGEAAARALLYTEMAPLDLTGEGVPAALAALASMVPEMQRMLGEENCYGLPLGLYAEGTLVNLPLLAALLNTKDLATLRRDLVNCSAEEWMIMGEALAQYLEKPDKMQFNLAGTPYTTPRYRPEEASALRGIYALSTANPGSYVQNNLGQVYAAGFVDPVDYLDTGIEEVTGILEYPLAALYRQVEFETRHMTGEEGPLSRGEDFPGQERVSTARARELFLEGAALFWKGNSAEGLVIEQETPGMQGNVFLIPNKLPFEEESVTVLNQMYGVGTDGYLCLRDAAAGAGAAGELLVQFFTDPECIRLIEEELYVLPFTDLYPADPLLAALEESFGVGEAYLLPLDQQALYVTEGRIGDFVNTNLMEKNEWTEEDEAAFMTAALGLLGQAYEEAAEEMAPVEEETEQTE